MLLAQGGTVATLIPGHLERSPAPQRCTPWHLRRAYLAPGMKNKELHEAFPCKSIGTDRQQMLSPAASRAPGVSSRLPVERRQPGTRRSSGRDAHDDSCTRVPAIIVLLQGQNSVGLFTAKHTHSRYSPTGCKVSTAASVLCGCCRCPAASDGGGKSQTTAA